MFKAVQGQELHQTADPVEVPKSAPMTLYMSRGWERRVMSSKPPVHKTTGRKIGNRRGTGHFFVADDYPAFLTDEQCHETKKAAMEQIKADAQRRINKLQKRIIRLKAVLTMSLLLCVFMASAQRKYYFHYLNSDTVFSVVASHGGVRVMKLYNDYVNLDSLEEELQSRKIRHCETLPWDARKTMLDDNLRRCFFGDTCYVNAEEDSIFENRRDKNFGDLSGCDTVRYIMSKPVGAILDDGSYVSTSKVIFPVTSIFGKAVEINDTSVKWSRLYTKRLPDSLLAGGKMYPILKGWYFDGDDKRWYKKNAGKISKRAHADANKTKGGVK